MEKYKNNQITKAQLDYAKNILESSQTSSYESDIEYLSDEVEKLQEKLNN